MNTPDKPKPTLLSLLLPLAGVGLAFLIASCERKSKSEKAAEEIGEAIEAVGDAVEDAASE